MNPASPTLTTPFQYFEVRPCIQLADETTDTMSFTSEEAFDEKVEQLENEEVEFTTFYTIYGIHADGRAVAVADDVSKDSAHDTLGGILGAFGAVRDFLLSDEPMDLIDRVTRAAKIIDDFIDNCSTPERI